MVPAAGLAWALATWPVAAQVADAGTVNPVNPGAGYGVSSQYPGLGAGGYSNPLGGATSQRLSSRTGSRTNSTRTTRNDNQNARTLNSRRDNPNDRRTRSTQPGTQLSTTPGGGPARAVPQGVSVVTRQATGRARSDFGPKPLKLPEVHISPEARSNAVYLTPPFQHVAPGDRFINRLVCYNARADRIDRIDLWVRYDTRLVEPVWVDVEPLKALSGNRLTVRGWREEGYVRIEATLSPPLIEAVKALAEIHWRAKEPSLGTRIELEAPPGERVALYGKGQNLLQATYLSSAPTFGENVRIAPRDQPDVGMRMVEETRRLDLPSLPTAPAERVRLAIVAPDEFVDAGAEATADVVLLNPAAAPIDTLRFRIRYDPRAVQILDADENNYIAKGINIFDGDFHEAFPFEYHARNRVDPASGTIDYEVGATRGPIPYPGGTVARIAYRLLRQADKAAFWFEWRDPVTGEATTAVAGDGRSLIDLGDAPASSVLHGVRVAVRPTDATK
jgi:hypothetical protein